MKIFLVVLCLISMFMPVQFVVAEAFRVYQGESESYENFQARKQALYESWVEANQEKVPALVVAAEKGDIEAKYQLADFLYNGSAGVIDVRRALYSFYDLANEGHKQALATLIEHYSKSFPDYDGTVYWLTKSYEHGEVEAMVELGDFYAKYEDYGYQVDKYSGYKQDFIKAFECYQLAVNDLDKPSAVGMFRLANAYMAGEGTTRNKEKALFWLDKGFTLAQSIDTESMKSHDKEYFERAFQAAIKLRKSLRD